MATLTLTQALLAVSAAGAVAGAVQQRRAGRLQRKQNKISNKIAAIQRQRSIKQSIAQRRIAVAQQQSLGFQLGVSGGTAVQGGVAGLTSDTASSIGASNLQFQGQQFISSLSDDISRARSSANTFGSVSQFAGGLANSPQAQAALTSLVG